MPSELSEHRMHMQGPREVNDKLLKCSLYAMKGADFLDCLLMSCNFAFTLQMAAVLGLYKQMHLV